MLPECKEMKCLPDEGIHRYETRWRTGEHEKFFERLTATDPTCARNYDLANPHGVYMRMHETIAVEEIGLQDDNPGVSKVIVTVRCL